MTVWVAQVTVFGLMAGLSLWDAWREQAPQRRMRSARWPANIGLAAINAGLMMVVPLSAVSAGLFAQHIRWGVFHQVSMPIAIEVLLCFALLTFVTYATHRAFHQIPMLWRLHRIHHCDTHLDSTTAFRHHPLEAVLSGLVKAGVVIVFGVDPVIVIAVLLVDQLWAVWTHSGLRLPFWLHRWVCFVFVTPLTHLIHHSTDVRETDTNYGNTVTVWDRLLGTHRVAPLRDEADFEIGLEFSVQDSADLDFLLKLPFKER